MLRSTGASIPSRIFKPFKAFRIVKIAPICIYTALEFMKNSWGWERGVGAECRYTRNYASFTINFLLLPGPPRRRVRGPKMLTATPTTPNR